MIETPLKENCYLIVEISALCNKSFKEGMIFKNLGLSETKEGGNTLYTLESLSERRRIPTLINSTGGCCLASKCDRKCTFRYRVLEKEEVPIYLL